MAFSDNFFIKYIEASWFWRPWATASLPIPKSGAEKINHPHNTSQLQARSEVFNVLQ